MRFKHFIINEQGPEMGMGGAAPPGGPPGLGGPDLGGGAGAAPPGPPPGLGGPPDLGGGLGAPPGPPVGGNPTLPKDDEDIDFFDFLDRKYNKDKENKKHNKKGASPEMPPLNTNTGNIPPGPQPPFLTQ
jgi:hypothetical protein